MEKQIKLEGKSRNRQEKLSVEYMPAICYGKGVEPIALAIKRTDFSKVLEEAGESHLISLKIGEQTLKVLIKDVQRDAVKNFPIHADFYQVNMKEEVHAEISLEFIGESKAVKEQGGILVKAMDAVEIICLPENLADKIIVDISGLDNLEDKITLADLQLPNGVKFDHYEDLNIVVAMIAAPKKQEEELPAASSDGEPKKEGENANKKEEAKTEEKK